MKKFTTTILALLGLCITSSAQTVEMLPYGDMNTWVTRNIKESRIIGGETKHCYEV